MKTTANPFSLFFSSIYIPVWIDLKGQFLKAYTIHFSNLHSSMDRFEVINNQPLVPDDLDLHSSMDRFEGF